MSVKPLMSNIDINLGIAGARIGIVAQLESEAGPIDKPVKVVDVGLLEPVDLVMIQPQYLQLRR